MSSYEDFNDVAISAMTAGERIVLCVTVDSEKSPYTGNLSLILAMFELRFLAAASE